MKFSSSSFSILKKKEGRRKKTGVYVMYHSNMSSLIIDLEWKVRTKNHFKAEQKTTKKPIQIHCSHKWEKYMFYFSCFTHSY